jgi:hypothetical protein
LYKLGLDLTYNLLPKERRGGTQENSHAQIFKGPLILHMGKRKNSRDGLKYTLVCIPGKKMAFFIVN